MIRVILFKDLKLFFRNPLTYIMLGLFSLIMGWVFFNQLSQFMGGVQAMPIQNRNQYDFSNLVVLRLFGQVNFLFLFFTPLLAMNTLSEEVRSRSILFFKSAGVKNRDIVIAKMLGLFIKGLCFLATVFIYPLLLGNIELTDSAYLISAFLGLALNMSCFLALGFIASSLSSNLVFCGVLSFFFVLGSWMVTMFSQMTPNDLLSRLLSFMAINTHFENLVKGNIAISDLVFYSSFLFLCLIFVHKRLELK